MYKDRALMERRIRQGHLRLIEGFSKYTVTEDGEVYHIRTAKPVIARVSKSGYQVRISLLNDEGLVVNIALERLIAHHFVPNPEGYTDVDFKDGDIGNYHMTNLYWVNRETSLRLKRERRRAARSPFDVS